MRILVTGGCGSIGESLVSRFLSKGYDVCSYDNSEDSLFHQKRKFSSYSESYKPFLGDIRDSARLNKAFKSVDKVFHCAALKHVAICEYNPFEALKTNVEGTNNVIEACVSNNVESLVFASSDKAVNPSSTMGSTKLLAEKLIISANNISGSSKFKSSCVRFGNVWGSNGSVGLIFNEQAKKNLEISLTDKAMSRYFITVEKSLDLCEFAMNNMKGGEVFVSSMGSTNIFNLAKAFISYHNSSSKIKIIGSQPGEKLYEELLTDVEIFSTIKCDSYYVYIPDSLSKHSKIMDYWKSHPSFSKLPIEQTGLRSDLDNKNVDPNFLVNKI